VRKTRNDRGAIQGLEFIKFGAVDQAHDHLAYVELLLEIGRDDAVEFADFIVRFGEPGERNIDRFLGVQASNNAPAKLERVAVVLGIIVGDAGFSRMHVGTAEIFRRNHFAGRRLH